MEDDFHYSKGKDLQTYTRLGLIETMMFQHELHCQIIDLNMRGIDGFRVVKSNLNDNGTHDIQVSEKPYTIYDEYDDSFLFH